MIRCGLRCRPGRRRHPVAAVARTVERPPPRSRGRGRVRARRVLDGVAMPHARLLMPSRDWRPTTTAF